MLIASTRSFASNACTSSVLPCVTRFGPSSARKRFTSAMSRSSTEPCQLVSTSPQRETTFLNLLEQPGDAAVGTSFVVVGPVRCENLIGLAPEQEIELLLEEAVDLFAEHLIPDELPTGSSILLFTQARRFVLTLGWTGTHGRRAPRRDPLASQKVIMQGAVLYGPRDVRFEERPEPAIVEPTDAILR